MHVADTILMLCWWGWLSVYGFCVIYVGIWFQLRFFLFFLIRFLLKYQWHLKNVLDLKINFVNVFCDFLQNTALNANLFITVKICEFRLYFQNFFPSKINFDSRHFHFLRFLLALVFSLLISIFVFYFYFYFLWNFAIIFFSIQFQNF